MTYYVARYAGYIICASEHKLNVVTYMGLVRKLDPKEYILEEKTGPRSLFIDAYPREHIEEIVDGIVLPCRDCERITSIINHFRETLIESYKFMSDLSVMAMCVGSSQHLYYKNAVDGMSQMLSDKKLLQKYIRNLIVINDIFKMPIHEYLDFIRRDDEEYAMRENFKMRMEDDN